jgi:hypothetical protein
MNNMPYLVTFPRSGSHYFDELIYEKKGIHIEKSHSVDELFDKNNQKKRKIITIVRDPIDSIISYRANEQKNFVFPLPTQKIRTHQVISEHILLHNFLYEHADYIIDFNDLVLNPEPTIKKIIDMLEISQEDYKKFDRSNYPNAKEYLPSSKKLLSYNKNILDGFNMDMCYFYYNKILEKKIEI